MRRGSWVLVSGLLLAGPACARHPKPTVEPAGSPARVEVANKFALPMEIYVVGSGINQRLGLVNPGMSGQVIVPPALVGGASVEFQAHPTAQNVPLVRGGPLLLAPGAIVDFQITPQIFNSTATLRP